MPTPFNTLEALCDEHECLVLDYHRKLANFRGALFQGAGKQEIISLKKEADAAKLLVDSCVRKYTPRILAKAYKKTARINYQENPQKSPVSQEFKREHEISTAKSALSLRFRSLQEHGVEVTVDSTSPYIHLNFKGKKEPQERIITLSFAKVVVKEAQHLLFFASWSLNSEFVSPPLTEEKDRYYFVLPLAFHPATEESAIKLVDWVSQLSGEFFNTPVAFQGQEVVDSLRSLQVVSNDQLIKDYPEVAPVIA